MTALHANKIDDRTPSLQEPPNDRPKTIELQPSQVRQMAEFFTIWQRAWEAPGQRNRWG